MRADKHGLQAANEIAAGQQNVALMGKCLADCSATALMRDGGGRFVGALRTITKASGTISSVMIDIMYSENTQPGCR